MHSSNGKCTRNLIPHIPLHNTHVNKSIMQHRCVELSTRQSLLFSLDTLINISYFSCYSYLWLLSNCSLYSSLRIAGIWSFIKVNNITINEPLVNQRIQGVRTLAIWNNMCEFLLKIRRITHNEIRTYNVCIHVTDVSDFVITACYTNTCWCTSWNLQQLHSFIKKIVKVL